MAQYSQIEIDELNKNISYPEGKIWWKPNKNFTSLLWENLKRNGYTVQITREVFTAIKDKEGNTILEMDNGWVNTLVELAKIMR